MYRKAVRESGVGYFYNPDIENGVEERPVYRYAIVGKESDNEPSFMFDDDDCMYVEWSGHKESGYACMCKDDFMRHAKLAKSPFVGGVNMSTGKTYTVTGDCFDIKTKTMLRNVTTSGVRECDMTMWKNVTKKSVNNDGWLGMTAYRYGMMSAWVLNEDECKNYL